VPPDNRRSHRHVVNLPATVVVGNGSPETCRIENLSLGGAYVSMHRIPMGERLRLTFRLPNAEESVDGIATVRWADDGGIGVQFDGLRARETWAIGKYLESLQ